VPKNKFFGTLQKTARHFALRFFMKTGGKRTSGLLLRQLCKDAGSFLRVIFRRLLILSHRKHMGIFHIEDEHTYQGTYRSERDSLEHDRFAENGKGLTGIAADYEGYQEQ
jgi:hypothetical protein